MGIDAEMFARHKGNLSPLEVRRLAASMKAAVGDSLHVIRPGKFSWSPEGRHCLEIIEKYEQDGPDIEPESGEQFIRVHLWERYYGPGYERGSWPDIFSVMMFLKANIPNCEVWYGGDSSGVLAEEMTQDFIKEMWEHYCKVGHEPYIERDNPYMVRPSKPICEFCGGREMWNQMMSRDGNGFTCEGCGYRVRAEKDDPTRFYECADVPESDPNRWGRKVV